MTPHQLPVDAAMQRGGQVDHGWTRAIHHGPLSIDQVLGRALAEMDAEDEAEAYRRDPLAYVAADRRKSTLFGRLFGRR